MKKLLPVLLTIILAVCLALCAHAEEVPEEAPELQLNTDVTATVEESGRAWFHFTPETSGAFSIYSISDDDTVANLYWIEDGELIWEAEDDDSGENQNFRIRAILYEGQTYYLSVQFYTEEVSSVTVRLESMGLFAEANEESVTVEYGESATLSVTAFSNNTPISFEWRIVEDEESYSTIDGETESSYTFQPHENQTIECHVSDGAGNIAVVPFTVYVYADLTVQAIGDTVLYTDSGESVTMAVSADTPGGSLQ